ncbi:MAG: hypothetical protein EXR52_00990 [Dehalococcoidia bacterium]|nr:hypothetical protein [Dehalococcoidia bacterium]
MALPPDFTTFRTCYQHPAGAIGVALSRWLIDAEYAHLLPAQPGTPDARGAIPALGTYRLTPGGLEALSAHGVDCTALRIDAPYQACADYTVRLADGRRGVPHVGSRLGAALTRWLLNARYAERQPHAITVYGRRTLQLTAAGRQRLGDLRVGLSVAVPG